MTHTPPRSPWAFFALTTVLATPLWILSVIVRDTGWLPKDIPSTDLLIAFMPLSAALILAARRGGRYEAKALLKRVFDARRVTNWAWWLPAIMLMPLLYGLGHTFTGGNGPTAPPLWLLPAVAILFLLLSTGEELGYVEYIEAMQRRWGAVAACLVFAVPWTAWHIPSMLLIGKGFDDVAVWLFIHAAMRVLLTWVYFNAGRSAATVIVMHASVNVGAAYLPGHGGEMLVLIAGAAVALLWDTRTLTRFGPRQALRN